MPRDAKLDAFVSTDADSDDGPEDGPAGDPDNGPEEGPAGDPADDPDDGPEDGPADDSEEIPDDGPTDDSADDSTDGRVEDTEDEAMLIADEESGADPITDVEATEELKSAITPTSVWTPDGATCPACGEQVERRWRQDGTLVCPDCKDWNES